ncbi:hypothetical protein Mapa_004753 [Marchantia paleacea]|nr:hypothetical protein Mapa_004753 [Marchantia paleacea]
MLVSFSFSCRHPPSIKFPNSTSRSSFMLSKLMYSASTFQVNMLGKYSSFGEWFITCKIAISIRATNPWRNYRTNRIRTNSNPNCTSPKASR